MSARWRLAPGERAVWLTATTLFLLVTAAWLEHQITWYLAVDQFGYLTFAHDLLAGRVYHEWAPFQWLARTIPPRTDALAQAYVYDHGRLYCRYSPGFPILLASWIGLLGDDAAHYLNLTLFLVLLSVLIAVQWRLLRSRWRALAGTVPIVVLPTSVYLWALTPTREVAAHLSAFTGLFLLLRAGGRGLAPWRTAIAGVALGYAASVRPDAILYLVPATLLVAVHLRRRRSPFGVVARIGVVGAIGVVVGLLPALAYNWTATGNPFRSTQGMELDQFLAPLPRSEPTPAGGAVGYPSPGWHGGTTSDVQGGGLRLANLPRTLPANLAFLIEAYTPALLAAVVWGGVVALMVRPLVFVTAVPYGIVALLLYSCWPRPDPRYLIGVNLLLPMLLVEGTVGTLDLVRRLAWRGRVEAARRLAFVAAAGMVLALVGAFALRPSTSFGRLAVPILLIAAGGAGMAATWPSRRVVAIVAPLLALTLTGIAVARAWDGLDRRAGFQRPQMLRARDTFRRAVEPRAIVITTEDIGRPAENIEYYSGVAHALYLTDLARWHGSVFGVALLAIQAGVRPYLLLPVSDPERPKILKQLAGVFSLETVRDIPPAQAVEYFVAAPFHRGVHLLLERITWPGFEKEKQGGPPG
ncbi:MAG: hypothetical protein E6J71_08335 [Deltaproteobacteria bacterium]|nr:MAG: hypothetical protein E6J71_08335 [Deltaproteobacteria bacterium]